MIRMCFLVFTISSSWLLLGYQIIFIFITKYQALAGSTLHRNVIIGSFA